MSLQEKVIKLKLDAALATRVSNFWEKQIAVYGEAKATAFYKHLGLNHLEKKSVEWEGLTLSREPTAAEKIAVKGIAGAQESSKEKITTILLKMRTELISDGLKGIKKLEPATYHELTLQASAESRTSLRDRLIKVHRQGRMLIAAELGKKSAQWEVEYAEITDEQSAIIDEHWRNGQSKGIAIKQADPDEFDDLDTLTDTTDSRVVNDTQSRIIASAAEWTLLGLAGSALWSAVQSDINAGSVSYIDRAAGGLSHRAIGIGRRDEMRDRGDEISRYEYSALLDDRVCENCAPLDGTTASSLDDLPEVPLIDCLGGSMCRCFIVAVVL